MRPTTVVQISGKQGSGKSTVQAALTVQLRRFNVDVFRMNYADTLYEMHDEVLMILNKYLPDRSMKKDGPLLQVLGTEWGRNTVDTNLWVNIVKTKVSRVPQGSIVIIGDCRFENEVDAFPDAVTVRLECRESIRRGRCDGWRENTRHHSELGLDAYVAARRFDLIVDTEDRPVSQIIDLIEFEVIQRRGGM